jgi:uncharacterized protein with ParB-like and HNH nuclease domain/predicted transport protein
MKATEAIFLSILKNAQQFAIPIYQRTYSWTLDECRQLWDDIIRTGGNDSVSAHFVGSIVYIEKGLSNLTLQEPMLVIDGQQRLTTLTLILIALAEALEGMSVAEQEPIDGFSPAKIRQYYLVNALEEGDKHYKLILSQTDKTTLKAAVDKIDAPADKSIRISENLDQFRDLIRQKKADLKTLCRGLAKLLIVDVALNRTQDNPQLIFESMNSTGRELSQADLIRNFVLMGLEPSLQTRLYEAYWRPMELAFGQEAYSEYFDTFMRHYLTVKTGEIPRIDEVYLTFKRLAREPATVGGRVEELVKELRDFATYYCAMALATEADPELATAFQDLRDLKVEVSYPFLLELYHDYKLGHLQKAELLAAVRLVETYVFRRAICAVPPNSHNKTFATLGKSLKKDRYLESIQAQFLSLQSYRRLPSDAEVQRDIQTRDLYNFRNRTYWIRRMENFGRKERVSVDEYSVEHILPQSDNDPQKLPASWRQELGEDWERVWTNYRHTLGNLTLTGYNSEYSNRPFAEKRDMEGGFRESPMRMNAGLGQLESWTEKAIQDRAERLAALAVRVWAAPQLPADVLEAYRPNASIDGYTRADHPHLTGAMGDLFDKFRKEVLVLDPCVTEEFLKFYVAYKAETNFVDVVPQAKRLRLALNMKFPEINDPRGLCRDISAIGRWGNGDVEVGLSDEGDLPYIIGLVRQSFERQMGDDE